MGRVAAAPDPGDYPVPEPDQPAEIRGTTVAPAAPSRRRPPVGNTSSCSCLQDRARTPSLVTGRSGLLRRRKAGDRRKSPLAGCRLFFVQDFYWRGVGPCFHARDVGGDVWHSVVNCQLDDGIG